MPAIVIVSTVADPHAQAVLLALRAHPGVTVELLDLGEFPSHLALTLSFTGAHKTASLRRTNDPHQDHLPFDLTSVDAIWWRRPQSFQLPPEIQDEAHQRFAVSESATAFQGLYQSLNAFWVNRPERDRAANHKSWQLALAQEIGFDIPPTLITNDPAAAQDFWSEHEDAVIYKQFIAMPGTWRETRLLKPAEKDFADSIRLAPVIFQRYVEGVKDLRVTVVGQQIFAAATGIHDKEYQADVRMNLETLYHPYLLPPSIEQLIHTFMSRLGLEYGTLDFRLTPQGQHIFFEINPAGQFLYIEQQTGQKITQALATHLIHGARR